MWEFARVFPVQLHQRILSRWRRCNLHRFVRAEIRVTDSSILIFNLCYYLPDIEECVVHSPCHQLCFNTAGSYNCSCQRGYMLNDDKERVKVKTKIFNINHNLYCHRFLVALRHRRMLFGRSRLHWSPCLFQHTWILRMPVAGSDISLGQEPLEQLLKKKTLRTWCSHSPSVLYRDQRHIWGTANCKLHGLC